MGKLDKAAELYLRGFNGEYIKRRTGISMQSLLKQLRAKGIKYTKDDIFEYQVSYISARYTLSDIEDAYRKIIASYADPYESRRGRHVLSLGCGFGDYVRVFKKLLGDERYQQLRNECWKQKQQTTVQQKYGVDNVFCKETFSQFVTQESVEQGRKKRTMTMVERYGVEHPNQNPEIAKRMMEHLIETNQVLYGVPHAMQQPEIAAKSVVGRQKAMFEKYGVKNSVESPEICQKIFESRRNNGTLNTSVPEDTLFDLLQERFGADDVLRNVIVDSRYPYHVDYYIPSRDLFIELNGDKCHNDHWFDATSVSDLQTVSAWEENAVRCEAETGKVSRYRKYIKTWTQVDVEKRNMACKHKLNYLVFWDGGIVKPKGVRVGRLRDAREWFAAGCPNSCDWNAENTY